MTGCAPARQSAIEGQTMPSMEMPMRIAVIGAGNVGSALGRAWLGSGEDVVFGVPNPADPKYRSLPEERLRTAPEAARNAEIVVLATPWPATEAAVKSLGDLSGKIIIDCTNPLGMRADGLELVLGHTTSGGEQVASWALGAAVFKTLDQIGAESMDKASLFPVRPVMLVAGDDPSKKPVVMSLVGKLGFEAVDAGPLRIARLLEPFGMLWIDQALNRGRGASFAFAITNRSGAA
jgi:hypothetical protein